MSVVDDTIGSMKRLEEEIRKARIAFAEAERIEEENDYDDALQSMDREHAHGWLGGLEFAYIILNGHEVSND